MRFICKNTAYIVCGKYTEPPQKPTFQVTFQSGTWLDVLSTPPPLGVCTGGKKHDVIDINDYYIQDASTPQYEYI